MSSADRNVVLSDYHPADLFACSTLNMRTSHQSNELTGCLDHRHNLMSYMENTRWPENDSYTLKSIVKK